MMNMGAAHVQEKLRQAAGHDQKNHDARGDKRQNKSKKHEPGIRSASAVRRSFALVAIRLQRMPLSFLKGL